MRILILSESPLDKIKGNYYAVDPWIRIAIALAGQCEKVTLWAPTREINDLPHPDSWRVEPGKLTIVGHDYYFRFTQYYKLLPRKFLIWRRKATQLIREHDIVVIRAPSPMTSLIVRCACKEQKPIVPIILGNLVTQTDKLIQSRGIEKLIYSIVLKFLLREERWMVKRSSLTYVYSRELADRFRQIRCNIKMMQDPHLSLKNFTYREDTCQSDEISILRVCWLIPSKGVEYLLESIALLRNEGFKVKLDIVGKERVKGYQAYLKEYIQKLGIHDYVKFSGWLPFERVSEAYRRNDIQVLSSLGEGAPRCIVEGFSHGLPLVCTAVGGCQDYLLHERDALLIPPKDPHAIVEAVKRIIKNKTLRQTMIQEGYKRAKEVTFELAGEKFIHELQGVVNSMKCVQ